MNQIKTHKGNASAESVIDSLEDDTGEKFLMVDQVVRGHRVVIFGYK